MNDIEEFTTDELRSEIWRRETAARENRCWYCNRNINAHTCKYAVESVLPGWEVSPPRFVQIEDCMGQAQEYWQVNAKHTVTGNRVIGNGDTMLEATEKCIQNCKDRVL